MPDSPFQFALPFFFDQFCKTCFFHMDFQIDLKCLVLQGFLAPPQKVRRSPSAKQTFAVNLAWVGPRIGPHFRSLVRGLGSV